MKRTFLSSLCVCLLAAPVVGQTFLKNLQALPSIPETTGLTVWLYGNQPGPDPKDLEQVEAARVLGGVLGYAANSKYVRNGARLAELSGARFGLRFHSWYKYNHPPDYRGSEFHDRLHIDRQVLERAKLTAGNVRVVRVELNIETWGRNDGTDRRRWNSAMTENHQHSIDMVYAVFGAEVEIGFYGYSPRWTHATLDEPITSASPALYRPTQQSRQEDFFNRSSEFMYARRLSSMTVWVTLSAGYDSNSKWQWELNPEIDTARWLGVYLSRGDHLQVHDIIIYDAFDQRATGFRNYLVPFCKALLGG